MAEYGHGGDIYSQEVELDYSANINPLGMPEGVKSALRSAADLAAPYPDSACRRLTEALAGTYGVKRDQIICGNGAADLIFQLVYGRKPGKALLIAPSFSEYEQALRAWGTQVEYCMLREEEGFAFSLEDWKRKAEEFQPELAFFCNPNNPTGLAVKKETVREMAEFCRERGIFLAVDECFGEFLNEPETCSVLDELEQFPNVFVLKAFTKLYAMAGVRLGYGFCADRQVLESMEAVRQPWSVSIPAQEAGIAALKETAYVERTKKLVAEQRAALKKGLEQLGFSVWNSQANYLFFRGPEKLKEELLKRKILIRSCANYPGLDGRYYRICVRTAGENEIFLEELEKTVKSGWPNGPEDDILSGNQTD